MNNAGKVATLGAVVVAASAVLYSPYNHTKEQAWLESHDAVGWRATECNENYWGYNEDDCDVAERRLELALKEFDEREVSEYVLRHKTMPLTGLLGALLLVAGFGFSEYSSLRREQLAPPEQQ